MPFTLSHTALVIPLYYLPKRFFCFSALFIGSMAPDFEYFLRMKHLGKYMHYWNTSYLLSLPIALCVLFLFHNIIRDPLLENLPQFIQKKFSSLYKFDWNDYFFRNISVVILSLSIGIIGHLFWDSGTFYNGAIVKFVPQLRQNFIFFGYILPGYRWFQHCSTVFGLLALFIFFCKLPKKDFLEQTNIKFKYWSVVLISGCVIFLIRVKFGDKFRFFDDNAVSIISSVFLGIILASIFFHRKKQIF